MYDQNMNRSYTKNSNRASEKQMPPNAITVKLSKSMQKAYVNKNNKQPDSIQNLKSILKS